jgi:hypothetical protein
MGVKTDVRRSRPWYSPVLESSSQRAPHAAHWHESTLMAPT